MPESYGFMCMCSTPLVCTVLRHSQGTAATLQKCHVWVWPIPMLPPSSGVCSIQGESVKNPSLSLSFLLFTSSSSLPLPPCRPCRCLHQPPLSPLFFILSPPSIGFLFLVKVCHLFPLFFSLWHVYWIFHVDCLCRACRSVDHHPY